jgi:DeoR family transcriptional regulator, suf operon transcriptional repressor
MASPPVSNSEFPLGQKGQRGTVLVQLKRSQALTAKQLADRLGVSLNAARHHLKELEAEGLIRYERSHRGVGAPAFSYRLSSAGEALFPRRYQETLTSLLDQIVEREGREAAVSLLEAHIGAIATRLKAELAALSPQERLAAIARIRTEQGYMAEATAAGDDAVLTEHNCAIQAVAERFPEICAAEARFLAEALGAQVNRRDHILSGCAACEYHVRFNTS